MENKQTSAIGKVDKSQDPWKVELLIHTTKDFIVYIHTNKVMFNDIKIRKKKNLKEIVKYGKDNIAKYTQNLIPINQRFPEIPSIVNYNKWKSGPLRRTLDKVAALAKLQLRNKHKIGEISFKNFVESCKSIKETVFRGDFNE